MTIETPYAKITFGEAHQRDLYHGGVEERLDSDGVRRGYHEASQTYWDMPDEWPESVTAQDVIDALRIALMAQKEPAEVVKIVDLLVEYAPETDSNRGIDLLLRLIAEAALKVSLADA